jgi:hypothetical protein
MAEPFRVLYGSNYFIIFDSLPKWMHRFCDFSIPFLQTGQTTLGAALISPQFKDDFSLYRKFVYITGGVKRKGSKSIDQGLVESVIAYNGKLGIGDRLRYRVKNISEGLAFGNWEFVFQVQERLKRKHIRTRSFMGSEEKNSLFFSTRVL